MIPNWPGGTQDRVQFSEDRVKELVNAPKLGRRGAAPSVLPGLVLLLLYLFSLRLFRGGAVKGGLADLWFSGF